MVYNTSNDIKIKVVEMLTPDWIREVISQDPVSALARRGMEEETEQSSGIAMGRVNSAGEQVDILNPMEDASEPAQDFKMADTMPPSKMSLDMFLPDARRRRKLVLHGSLEQSTQSRQDDIAVQEQMFNLLRNIICGTGASEMIDYLFKEIGQDELLNAIADKLRARSIQLPHRRDASSRSLHVPNEILIAATALVIHLAAGLPRHRQVLMSHSELLKSLTNYFNHSNRDVRVNCVWVVINLVYEEDQSDREGCRERADQLKALGVIDRLASLHDDVDLDVKERTKMAMQLLNSVAL